ncbi:MAG: plastocyanin/azurin family copper-binding protein [Vicinamibacterales bacterium]
MPAGTRRSSAVVAGAVALLSLFAALLAPTEAAGPGSGPDGQPPGRRIAGVVHVAGRPQAGVVVWLDAPAPTRPRPDARPPVVLDQRNMQFSPRLLVVPVGTTVEMPNSDRVFHNIFSFRDGKVFDLGLYPVGQSRSVTFDRPGVSRLFCNIHPAMAAYVVVVDSPFHAITDTRGRFAIDAVPDGPRTYHAWRPGAEPAQGTIGSALDDVSIALP